MAGTPQNRLVALDSPGKEGPKMIQFGGPKGPCTIGP